MYRIRQKAPDSCIEFQTSFSIIVGVFCLIISIVVSLSESNCSLYAPDGIRTHETTEVATATSAYALEGQRLGPLGHVDGRSLTFTNRHSRTSRKSGSWLWPVSVGPLKQRSKQAMYIEAKQRVRASLKSGFFDDKNYFQTPSLAVIGNAAASKVCTILVYYVYTHVQFWPGKWSTWQQWIYHQTCGLIYWVFCFNLCFLDTIRLC